MADFIVTEAAMRPASPVRECFYCQRQVGTKHATTCVLVKRPVKIRMVVEYEVSVPASWDTADIEFQRNMGSWCADNALEELQAFAEKRGCLCDVAEFTFVEDMGPAFLCEGGGADA